ncbi:tigger transposable element-derived protein 4-like [Haliotis asinina]|uniref:tigger transposable element-derived protein 4-like n=1 Tax=Haliotis asinina TaxID=109174 RepID=UPI003531C60B
MESVSVSTDFSPDRKKMHAAIHQDVEDALFKWSQAVRSENIPLSGPMLQAKAEELGAKLGHPDFSCHTAWINKVSLLNSSVTPDRADSECDHDETNNDELDQAPPSFADANMVLQTLKNFLVSQKTTDVSLFDS